MNIGLKGFELVKTFEGFSSKPYICPGGWLTIGYGHVIRGKTFDTITREEAEGLLKQDLNIAERAVRRLIRAPLTQNMFDSLCSWTFNLGSGALQRSTLRMKLNREEYDEVPNEIRKWVFAGGRKLRGLVLRREAEAGLFTSEEV